MTERSHTKTWVVGREYDKTAFVRLGKALKSLGYRIDQASWGVAGSQEVSEWDVRSTQGTLGVESETYVGLSVTGPPVLVDAVRRRFESPDVDLFGV